MQLLVENGRLIILLVKSGTRLEGCAIICRYYNDLHVFDLDHYKVSTLLKIDLGYDKFPLLDQAIHFQSMIVFVDII